MTKNLNMLFFLIVLVLTVMLFTGCGGHSSGNYSSVSDEPPTAVASANPTSGNAPIEVYFDGSYSSDDNGIDTYSWTFGDGSSGIGVSVSHVYTHAGSYMITLTVTDSQGQIDTAQLTISVASSDVAFALVDTGQDNCYDDSGVIICPQPNSPFYGQDAQYQAPQPSYVDNGDGTVTDLNTGLMWQQEPGLSDFGEAFNACSTATTGGHSDWRVPTIKELYSLIDFSGCTGTGPLTDEIPDNAIPYINRDFFTFYYGTEVNEPGTGDRFIDSQYISSTEYTSTVFDTEPAFFGVNFADGRIKGYPQNPQRVWFLRCVRGDSYGSNLFENNNDGTISDLATGLMWMRADSGTLNTGGSGAMDWEESLAWCEGLNYSGYDDWRLPNTKELQSIVDYTRSPDATGSAAISPLFYISAITNEAGNPDYPYFWTSTTHLDGVVLGSAAVYIAFGRALGYMNGRYMDVHGAGAQRSDPKDINAGDADCGHGPQGDCRRIYNFARCVRSMN